MPLPALRNLIILLGVTVILAACAQPNPLGLDDATFNSLTPEQRLQAFEEQAAIDAQKAVAAEAARQEAELRLARLYNDEAALVAQGGISTRISQVTITGGEVRVPVGGGFSTDQDFRQLAPVSFSIAECETRPVTLQRADKSGSRTVFVSRRRGTVFIGNFLNSDCTPDPTGPNIRSFPPSGQFPLDIRDTVRGAVVSLEPFGGDTDNVIIQVR